MFNRIWRKMSQYLAAYDKWLAANGLDKPCRSCIPREHTKPEQD
ncbi:MULTISPECIES: hypothetical protein [unclassified Agarivorans]|nr:MULTISPECIES: hypothetical protein [unclassified Agarivorans]MDO6685193.1 hypothetical protein [Agarivorans sp. 3_MG-2023]MDO6715635.1 hypothetical protein [Agarivorans sp. 2_MG-2023]MDO6763784.1 hypothetical protein [Agarivorans sp. 1_MG-2023]